MTARARWATGYARRLINELDINDAPVGVKEIAERNGVEVVEEVFPDNISGALHRGPERSVIAVNKAHSETRQRFTISHELGHYFLHRDSPAFYDVQHQIGSHFRAKVTGTQWDPKEVEANKFAAELLMPRKLLIARVRSSAEVNAVKLAAEFKVSPEAMTYRLAELRFA
jgi:Zn-dependent peptidase ImmA (M78 family)